MAAMQQPETCHVDDSFGPWAGESCRGGFDFTLLFEESILAIPIHALFLLAVPICVTRLSRTNTKVNPSLQRLAKAVIVPPITIKNKYFLTT